MMKKSSYYLLYLLQHSFYFDVPKVNSEQILFLNYGAGNADQLPQPTINSVQICIVVTESDLWLLHHHFPNLYSSGKLVACNNGSRLYSKLY